MGEPRKHRGTQGGGGVGQLAWPRSSRAISGMFLLKWLPHLLEDGILKGPPSGDGRGWCGFQHLLKARLTEGAPKLPSQAASPTAHPRPGKQQFHPPRCSGPNPRVTLDSCPFPDPFHQQIPLALPSQYTLSPATHQLRCPLFPPLP